MGSLNNIRRPASLIFAQSLGTQGVTVPYLEEKVFLPFLMQNKLNKLDLHNENFDCTDCHNYWLKYHPDLLSQVEELKCASGKQFTDESNFKHC